MVIGAGNVELSIIRRVAGRNSDLFRQRDVLAMLGLLWLVKEK
jgi:hypothetical protein